MDTQVAAATPSQIDWHKQALERQARFYGTKPKPIFKIVEVAKVLDAQGVVESIKNLHDTRACLDLIRLSFPGYFLPATPRAVSHDILEAICHTWGISKNDLVSERRTADLIPPRHVAYALFKQLTRLSLPAVGRIMGNRNHTTILYGIRRIQPVINRIAPSMSKSASPLDWAGAIKAELSCTPVAAVKLARSRMVG